jgi:hypothetical protein
MTAASTPSRPLWTCAARWVLYRLTRRPDPPCKGCAGPQASAASTPLLQAALFRIMHCEAAKVPGVCSLGEGDSNRGLPGSCQAGCTSNRTIV